MHDLEDDVSDLQNNLQNLEDDVNEKCVQTIEIKDGVLKAKRMDDSFTGSVDVILSSTLNAAVSSYLGTTLYKTLTELQTLGYKTLTELQTLGYYTLSQIQALNYVTKTTSSSWTSNAFISLSTDTHNQEVTCNFSKRSGLKANNPSPNDYAQENATNIELWDFSDSAGLVGAGGFHFNTTSERLAVANIPAISECFNHHLNVKCRDFYLNFNITKWLANTVANNWEWQDGLTTIVLFCKPEPPSHGIANWLAAAPGSNSDYPLLGIPRSGIHIQIEADSSFDDHDTYGGQTKSVEIGHYNELTYVSWGDSGSATNGVGLADAVSYDVSIQAKHSRLFVRIQPQGVPRGAATEFGSDATLLFTFVMPTEFGTDLTTADTAGRLFYTNGGNIVFNTNQNIELSHLKILSDET